MSRLVEMVPTWFFDVTASDVLFVLRKSLFKAAGTQADIFAFWEIFAIRFNAFPVIDTIPRFTIYRIFDFMFESSIIAYHLGGWGESEWTTGC